MTTTEKSENQPARHRRWPRRVLGGLALGLCLFTVIGFFVVPPIARHVAETQIGKLLGRRVSIARVRVNPFALSLTVEGFRIYEPDGITDFVGFGRLYVNAQLASVFRRAPVIKEIRLESPRVRVVRVKATPDAWADTSAYNFSDILARFAAQPAEPPTPGPPPRFSINNVRILDGAFTLDDQPLSSHHEITAFALGVPFISTLPVDIDAFVEPGLALRVDGTPFEIKGRSKPFKDSLETILELRIQSLDLTRYVPYVPVPLAFGVRSAAVSLALDVSFVRFQDLAPNVTVSGSIALDNVALDENGPRARPLLALPHFEVQLARTDVTGRHVKIDHVLLAGMNVHARRLPDGTLDWQHLVAAPPAAGAAAGKAAGKAGETAGAGKGKAAPSIHQAAASSRQPGTQPATKEPPLRFELRELRIEKAALHLRDETVRPEFVAAVEDIAVTVRGLSNAPGAKATMSLGLRATPGGTLTQQGSFSLSPNFSLLLANGTVTLDGVEPARFAPYTHARIAFDIVRGRVRLGSSYRIEQRRAGQPMSVLLDQAFVEVKDLALHRAEAKDNFFSLSDFAVRGAAVDLDGHAVTVAEVSTHEGRIRAARDEKGIVDLTTLMPAPSGPAETPAPPATEPSDAPPPGASPDWTLRLRKLDVDKWGVRFDDRLVVPRAVSTVDPITLRASDLSTVAGEHATVDLRLGINKTGRLTVNGTVSPKPAGANIRIDLKALEILPLQPYFADLVNLTVTSGAVSVKGRVKVDVAPPPVRGPPGPPRVGFDGDVDVVAFASVDREKTEDLLAWKGFHIGGIHATSEPAALTIHEISLTDFQSRLVMSPDAHLNVADAATPPATHTAPTAARVPTGKAKAARTAVSTSGGPAGSGPATSPSASASPAPQIAIDSITLKGGHVSFRDQSVTPNFTAELTDLGGRLSALSTDPRTQADVDLRSAVNNAGILTIVGKANPLAKDLSLDVKVDLKDFELPPTSPYASKYAGYDIAKGKLNLSLAYRIADRKLAASNRVVLDQFTFGNKTPSPDAVKVPVRLAIAILKDRHGVIDIDLPIAGSLDDPEFKLGRLILKTIGNLVVKAVTAPFSLLASALGGDDEMSQITFPAGSAAPDAKGPQRIKTLSKVLQERPGLSFEIEGVADPQRDKDGLRQRLFERKLKAQKAIELVKGGAAVTSPDDVTFDPSERAHLLEAAYTTATFPKPRNPAGREKTLTPDEQQKLLLENTPVTDDDLRSLALRRATAVQDAIARSTPGAAPRLFLVTPRVASPGNRVDLRLKKD